MAVARGYDTERQALPQSCGGRLGDHLGQARIGHMGQVRARSGSLIARKKRNGGR